MDFVGESLLFERFSFTLHARQKVVEFGCPRLILDSPAPIEMLVSDESFLFRTPPYPLPKPPVPPPVIPSISRIISKKLPSRFRLHKEFTEEVTIPAAIVVVDTAVELPTVPGAGLPPTADGSQQKDSVSRDLRWKALRFQELVLGCGWLLLGGREFFSRLVFFSLRWRTSLISSSSQNVRNSPLP